MKWGKCLVPLCGLFFCLYSPAASGKPKTIPVTRQPAQHRASAAALAGDENWDSQFHARGTNYIINAMAVDGNDLYIGGHFTSVDGIPAAHIAKWDGSSWSSLGDGIDKMGLDYVFDLVVYDGKLYAAGTFDKAGDIEVKYIACWDGSAWHDVGGGANSAIRALAVHGGELYAGGYFSQIGGLADVNYIARWDGTAWNRLGGGVSGTVCDLTADEQYLYAGGYFDIALDPLVILNKVARWDGSVWSALGDGVSSSNATYPFVTNLAAGPCGLVASGYFSLAGGEAVNNIAQWDGSAWSAMGDGFNSPYALLCDKEAVYANTMVWDGSSWSMLGGAFLYCNALVKMGTDLIAGGWFTLPEDHNNQNIARWDGSSWSSINGGYGLYGGVSSFAKAGNKLYLGTSQIYEFRNDTWMTLGDGVRGYGYGEDEYEPSEVNSILSADEDLYVGGWFSKAGGQSASNIAKWDGTSWDNLGGGSDNGYYSYIKSLLKCGSDLYTAGSFFSIGGVAANNIARWDGAAWHNLGSGIENASGYIAVYALAMRGSELIAGGGFNTAGGAEAANIAKWDGSAWSAMGSGVNGVVYSVASHGTDLFAAGEFTTAGGIPAAYIAKWDGSSWSALGSGMDGPVRGLFFVDGALFACGSFTSAGGTSAANIAKWDGVAWTNLGSGMDGTAAIIAGDADSIFVGGSFTTAGGKPSTNLALWHNISSPKPDSSKIKMTPGWNLVSTPVMAADLTLVPLVSGLDPHLVIMKNGKGQVYWPAFGINQIINWNMEHGYQVYVNTPDTLIITGNLAAPESTPLSLAASWNMISYLRDSPMAISTALASISPYLVIVKNGAGKVYWPALGINGIGDMRPGEGYLVYVNQVCTLTYPANDAVPKAPALTAQELPLPAHYAFFRANTGENATLLISTSGLPDGAEIGAWTTRGLLIGAGMIQQNRALLTLWGDDELTRDEDGAKAGEALALTCWRPNDKSEQPVQLSRLTDGLSGAVLSGDLIYQSNAVWQGAASMTASLPTEYSLSQNYPNPFNPRTNINYQLPEETEVELVIYDLSGRRVRTLVNGRKSAGFYYATWDGRDDCSRLVSSGIYWIKMKAGFFQTILKASLIK